MEITYESIKNLIADENWTGNQVNLKFKAQNQDQAIETIGVAMPSQEDMMKKMAAEMAKVAASNVAVNSASNALGNLTGVAGAGSIISGIANQANIGYQMDPMAMMNVDLTDEVKQATIVNAFLALSNYFQFENGNWVFKQA